MTDLFAHIASTPTLRAAFERVRDNHGCAGADGVSIAEYEKDLDRHLALLGEALERGTYRPFPLLRILVEKHDGSARQLLVPTVRDRVAQAAALEVLGPLFEAEFEACSFGYRPGRSVRDAVNEIKRYYEQGYRWVAEADVDSYFDTVDHALLLRRLRDLLEKRQAGDERRKGEVASRLSPPAFPAVLRSDASRVLRLIELWIAAEVWDGSQLYRMKQGIPQGSVISPALANLFLDDLDEALLTAGQKLVRYADDFVVLCKDQPSAQRALALSEQVLASMHLTLDDKAVTDFEHGFTFLGVTFMRSLILEPFDRPKREHKVLFMPPYLDPGKYRESSS